MNEKYYVVSESELFALSLANCKSVEDWDKAEAACRARPCIFDEDTYVWVEVQK